jgi:hypothetical protein
VKLIFPDRTCVRCGTDRKHPLSYRHTRDGWYCHDCWTTTRRGLYEAQYGTQRRGYRDPQQRRR